MPQGGECRSGERTIATLIGYPEQSCHAVGAFRRESAGLLWGKLGAANRAGRPRSRGGKGSSEDRTICGGNRVSRTALPCCRKAFGRKADKAVQESARFVGEIGHPEQRYRAAESPRSRGRGRSGERTIATLVENWVCPNSATVLSESSWSRGGQSRSGVRTIQFMLWEKLGAANTATVLPRSRGGQWCQSSRARVSVPEGTLAVAEVRG